MRAIKGPGVFLAQFAADQAPYNSLPTLAKWAADKGFEGSSWPALSTPTRSAAANSPSARGWILPAATAPIST